MSDASVPPSEPPRRRQGRGLLPPTVLEVVTPPLEVAAWSGAAGAVVGVGMGIATETSPLLNALVNGTHWLKLGGSYWFARTIGMRYYGGEERVKPIDKTLVSTISGAVAGAFVSITHISTIKSTTAMWAVFGGVGQMIANKLTTRREKLAGEDPSWMNSQWVPLKKLSDQEYSHMLEEKMLRFDADIALVDERIAELQRLQAKNKTETTKDQGAK
ncbi:hypothetical protein B0I35DRAFT_442976 [Stachybotrys elegans]|uniref:Uncharacterized protein n=1 Tax=Stachybotrys elegans TaxID=80388 RepID=A0A8K0SKB9_9HYPO|nr:hypothetical protein B0I35DRAFT_442976 [Stachybotrys elegans]